MRDEHLRAVLLQMPVNRDAMPCRLGLSHCFEELWYLCIQVPAGQET